MCVLLVQPPDRMRWTNNDFCVVEDQLNNYDTTTVKRGDGATTLNLNIEETSGWWRMMEGPTAEFF